MALLSADKVTKSFGALRALNEVCLTVKKDEVVGLIGPNGSGKTTFFNCVNGFIRPEVGAIYLNGHNLVGLKPNNVANLGLGRTFQLTRVFKDLTVLENMLVGQPHRGERIIGNIIRESPREMVERARELLELVNLTSHKDKLARELSYGQQKLLDFARVLMGDFQILLLDEPFGGVNPTLIKEMIGYLKKSREQGKTLFIIEHNIPAIMSLAERMYVLATGEVVAEGTPEEIRTNETVIEAYFGAVHAARGF